MRPSAVLALSLLPTAAAREIIRCSNNSSPVDWDSYGIILKSTMNFEFLLNNSRAAAQVCLLSGHMVGHGLGVEGPTALRILPIHTHTAEKNGYVAAAVVVAAPKDLEEKLNADIQDPNSTLYQHPQEIIRNLTQQIDASERVIIGELCLFWTPVPFSGEM
jgi:hypothetical protein